MKRLLVTGATGFLGVPTVRLANEHFEVHVIGRAPRSHTPHGVHFHSCDLLSPGNAAAIIDAVRPTHLIHLAWFVTPGEVWMSPENERWKEASQQLLLAFARSGGKRAVVAGTCAEYDWTIADVCREVDPTRPHTTYGQCKLELCNWANDFGHTHGVTIAWARLFFLYGPGEHPTRLVPSVIRSLLAGTPALCTSGVQERDFLHVEDAATAIVALAKSDITGPVNIGSGEAVAVRTIIEQIAAICGRPDLVRLGAKPMQPLEPPRLVADIRRLRDGVGWRQQIALPTGLQKVVEWWRSEEGR